MPNNIEKGVAGEEIAVAHLLKNGYEILEKNWRFKHRKSISLPVLARPW